MIEMAQIYPYFNEDAENNWKRGNSNMEMSQAQKRSCFKNELRVEEIRRFKVHDMTFKKQVDTSMPLIDCPQHSTDKEK